MSPEWLARLTALCGMDSPTGDAAALVQTAALLAEWGRADGLEVEIRETPTGPIVVLVTQGRGHRPHTLDRSSRHCLSHRDCDCPPGPS